ncbi:MAG TPA: RICIN domain-containing protein, partial [Myxococcaceae bacterium]|nr:RICIN domain-containing protein [Myxococcaceae bacterium]
MTLRAAVRYTAPFHPLEAVNMNTRGSTMKVLLLALGIAGCGSGLEDGEEALSETPDALVSAAVIPQGVYELRNQCSGKLLEVSAAGLNNGARVHQWTALGAKHQQWRLKPAAGGSYLLVPQHSVGKALDVSGSGTADGTRVLQWADHGGPNQRWLLTPHAKGLYELSPAHAPGKALDISGASRANGAPAQIWSDNGTCAQRWSLQRVGSVPPPLPPSPAACTPPARPADVSNPTTVVGRGTPASCTEAALVQAVSRGGIITFNCGSAPFTFKLTQQINIRTDQDTVIDGGGRITLDGDRRTRILSFNTGDYRRNAKRLTVQNLTFANGKSTGTPLPAATYPNAPRGVEIDGGGAAIYIRDNRLLVVDSIFENNEGAALGPDVGGGAIYGLGALDVTIVGSRFSGNAVSNGGAVGALQTGLTLVNNVFTGNRATGHGANSVDGSGRQVGSGGNGGAVVMDGTENGTATLCGNTFTGNSAGALGGAIFRTVNTSPQATSIDRSTFDGNVARAPVVTGEVTGGSAMYLNNVLLTLTRSTLSNNVSESGSGAIQIDGSSLTVVNATFWGNEAKKGLGGAVFLGGGNSGTFRNVTFANNRASGGFGYFSAAIFGS